MRPARSLRRPRLRPAADAFKTRSTVGASEPLAFGGASDVRAQYREMSMKVLVAACLGFVTVFTACRRDPPPSLDLGREMYAVAGCASCHGRNGHGDGGSAGQLKSPPRDFRDGSAFTNGRTVDAIAVTIANGVLRNGSQMPGFPHLTERERRSLALFVMSLGDQSSADATTGAGTGLGR
jgi:mono/diheme cytochrome c family protein